MNGRKQLVDKSNVWAEYEKFFKMLQKGVHVDPEYKRRNRAFEKSVPKEREMLSKIQRKRINQSII